MAITRDIDTPQGIADVKARALLNWTTQQRKVAPEARQRWEQGSLNDTLLAMQQAAREMGYL